MKTKRQQMQDLIRHYRDKIGQQSVTMADVAKYAASLGWELPTPKSPLDRLAEQFASAARDEIRKDSATGRPYRANLAVTIWHGKDQQTLWTDIDEAPRHIAHKAFQQRREQMVGDAVQLSFDAEHWNRVNPVDAPIDISMDFEPDVEWRRNSDDGETAA